MINIGKEQEYPKQKIAQEIINKVNDNFKEYEGTQVFERDLPHSITPVVKLNEYADAE